MLPTVCPCCSGKDYQACCKPIHDGDPAPSPEALMRSRFSAHAMALLDYILESWAASERSNIDHAGLKHWLNSATFGLLSVLEAKQEGSHGTVEFVAWYQQDGQLHALHDRSHFIQEQGRWRYLNSSETQLKPAKLGRNDPCPCLSGKKHKQCCANCLASAP